MEWKAAGEAGAEAGEEAPIKRAKYRRVQAARPARRRLFGEAAQREFLERFAASCNAKLAAEQTGICETTVYAHRMKDPRFREGWDRAVEQGYARLEAELLRRSMEEGPIPIAGDGDGAAIAGVDTALALALLRQHQRGGTTEGRRRRRAPPRVASNAEVRTALIKRLKAFHVRVREEEVPALPAPAEGAGPAGGAEEQR